MNNDIYPFPGNWGMPEVSRLNSCQRQRLQHTTSMEGPVKQKVFSHFHRVTGKIVSLELVPQVEHCLKLYRRQTMPWQMFWIQTCSAWDCSVCFLSRELPGEFQFLIFSLQWLHCEKQLPELYALAWLQNYNVTNMLRIFTNTIMINFKSIIPEGEFYFRLMQFYHWKCNGTRKGENYSSLGHRGYLNSSKL